MAGINTTLYTNRHTKIYYVYRTLMNMRIGLSEKCYSFNLFQKNCENFQGNPKPLQFS